MEGSNQHFQQNPQENILGANPDAVQGDAPADVIRDRMPLANLTRIMKKALPPHAKIADASKIAMQDSVTEFISFITGEANDRCRRDKRTAVSAEDLIWAMNKFGFDDYVGPLNTYLARYRVLNVDPRRPRYKRRADDGASTSFPPPANLDGPSGFLSASRPPRGCN